MEEARRGTTLIGPQRDDLSFQIDGLDARTYGSQGQQRTVALALKLAEFRLIEDYVGEPPVMLLDDVMSDLDDTRRKHLLAWVRRRCQTFLTCTNLRSFNKEILAEAAIFHVVAGTVTADAKRKT
jgi:DNA replication and repair protein RecF